MKKILNIKNLILLLLGLILIWLIFFNNKELSVTYDSVEEVYNETVYGRTTMANKSMAMNAKAYTADTALGAANYLSPTELYVEEDVEEESGEVNAERYRENKFYRVDTPSFDNLIEAITSDVEALNGTIKVNNQNSNKKVVYDKEFYPRLQTIEFIIDNKEVDVDRIEETLKKYGDIRISNSNKTSIEQELTNYEQQLKEMEEARKALQESKDKDWIARQDADYAKRSERLKNQIENAKKQSTYKTYNIDVYEVIKFRVNALRHWYSNNYSLKNAISDVLPHMVKLFAILIPITVMLIILILVLYTLYKNNKRETLRENLKIIKEELDTREIHFDIKM